MSQEICDFTDGLAWATWAWHGPTWTLLSSPGGGPGQPIHAPANLVGN